MLLADTVDRPSSEVCIEEHTIVVVVVSSSQETSGKPEYMVTLEADLLCTLSRLPVMETVVERGAGMRDAWESTSLSRCDWNGAM